MVLQGLELGLGEEVVIADVGAAQRARDAEVGGTIVYTRKDRNRCSASPPWCPAASRSIRTNETLKRLPFVLLKACGQKNEELDQCLTLD